MTQNKLSAWDLFWLLFIVGGMVGGMIASHQSPNVGKPFEFKKETYHEKR